MSKNFLFRFLLAAGALGAAVLWLLTALKVIDGYNWAWTVVVVGGAWGLAYLIRGIFSKSSPVLRKMNIFVGVGLLAVAVVALVLATMTVEPDAQLIFAIAATALFLAVMLGVLVTGGKKWDEGDNQKAGYKNYYQRKAEQEKADRENDENN